jgi:hypothetical protein
VTDEREAIVRAFLQAQSELDVDSLRRLIADDFELRGRDGLVRDGDAFLAGVGRPYDHLDDVFTLIEFTDGVARIRRELRWRENGELSAHREVTYRYTVRDGRISAVELVMATPWVRA